MEIPAFLQDHPREIKISTAIMAVLAWVQFTPINMFRALPAQEFFSGLFSNTVGFVVLMGTNFQYHRYVLGVALLTVVTATFLYGKRSWPLHFLASVSVAFYGFLTLAMSLVSPGLLSDTQVVGVGAQTVIMGLAATETYTKLLKTESFSPETRKYAYATASWLSIVGLSIIGAAGIFRQARYLRIDFIALYGSVALSGLLMIYAGYELVFYTKKGFWLSSFLLTGILVLSAMSGAVVGSLVPFGLLLILWMKREDFDIEIDFQKFREYLLEFRN